MLQPVVEADLVDQVVARTPSRAFLPRELGRQQDVLLGREHRQQVEELEDETDVLRRSFVSSLSSRFVISVPSIETEPEVGRSRPARMCMSVDLPEPDGPMTAVSLRGRDVERDAAQRVDRGVSAAVAAGDVVRGDDGVCGRLSALAMRECLLPCGTTSRGAGGLPQGCRSRSRATRRGARVFTYG